MASINESGVTVEAGEKSYEKIISLLQEKVATYCGAVEKALLAGDDDEIINALVVKQSTAENNLNFYVGLQEKADKANKGDDETTKQAEKKHFISISRKDIPHFQLKSDIPVLFPNEIKFESVTLFLEVFESTLLSGNLDLENSWREMFPISLHPDHFGWYKREVVNVAKTWEDVKNLMNKQFGNQQQLGAKIEDLWTTKMNDSESINEYTERFLKAIEEAGSDDYECVKIGSYFVSSCIAKVKATFYQAWYTNHTQEDKYTVKEAAGIMRNILGGSWSFDKWLKDDQE
ncbi:hypothetical protein ABG067_008063, partial [Albugo candida]